LQICESRAVKQKCSSAGDNVDDAGDEEEEEDGAVLLMMMINIYLFIYLFKTSDRRTQGPLILSEEHRNT